MQINSISELKKGMIISGTELMSLFKCSGRGGMRRSLKTNSLVLLSYKHKPPYKDIEKDENTGLWEFTGMGRIGHQDLNYMQNKTLHLSNISGVKLYLFSVEGDEYKFIDRVLLAGEPWEEQQHDEEGKERRVYMFPLLEVGNCADAYDFFLGHDRSNLVNKNIIGFPRYELSFHSLLPLTSYMKSSDITTLEGPGGWFLNVDGYFHNPNTKRKTKVGNIFNLVNNNSNYNHGTVFENQNKYINPFFGTPIDIVSDKTEYKSNQRNESFTRAGFLVHKLFYRNQIEYFDIDFVNGNRSSDGPFFTLIIGPNGTGKSTVLSIIQKIFISLYEFKNSRSRTFINNNDNYTLTYQIGESVFTVIQKGKKRSFFLGEQDIHIQELLLPNHVIASAFTINDRFTFMEDINDERTNYSYLGAKSSNSTIKIGETSKNLVLNILNSSQKNYFEEILNDITSFIQLEPRMRIEFITKNNETLESFKDNRNILKQQNNLRKSIKSRTSLKKIHFADSEEIKDFFNRLDEDPSTIFLKKESSIIINFELDTPVEYERYYEDIYILWHLFEIGIFNEPIVYFKKNRYFKLEEASSGESQFITTLINILSKVESDSLILIDEPETSFHPNWQRKYINGIRTIFKKNYSSAHFILATHSHFMVSDLMPDSSSLVSFKRDDEYVMKNTLHEVDTFGWSVEDILLNIFEMASDRNYYLADKIDKILMAISMGEIDKVKGEIEKLNVLCKGLKDNDPLKQIIELIYTKSKGE